MGRMRTQREVGLQESFEDLRRAPARLVQVELQPEGGKLAGREDEYRRLPHAVRKRARAKELISCARVPALRELPLRVGIETPGIRAAQRGGQRRVRVEALDPPGGR